MCGRRTSTSRLYRILKYENGNIFFTVVLKVFITLCLLLIRLKYANYSSPLMWMNIYEWWLNTGWSIFLNASQLGRVSISLTAEESTDSRAEFVQISSLHIVPNCLTSNFKWFSMCYEMHEVKKMNSVVRELAFPGHKNARLLDSHWMWKKYRNVKMKNKRDDLK